MSEESEKQILVVEDETIIALELKHTLEDLGYQVTDVMEKGETVVDIAREQPPDLILLDIQLKGDMNGIEVGQTLRRQDNIPILYLTANADQATMEQAKETAPWAFLTKPVEDHELRNAIEIALSKKQMETKIKTLEKKSAMKHLMAGLLHEINNPLAIMGGNVEYLKRAINVIRDRPEQAEQLEEDLLDALHSIDRSHRRIEDIVRKVKGYSQSGDPSMLELQTVEMSEILDPLKERWLSDAPDHYDIEITETTEPVHLLTNPIAIETVLNELITNSVKAVDRSDRGDHIWIDVVQADQEAHFKIRDNAGGLDENDIDNLFNPLYKGNRAWEGVGMGLSLSEKLVEQIEADIEVTRADKHTEFTVRIPLEPS